MPPLTVRPELQVLVVEDYDDARRQLADCLSDAGYRVAEASNGQEALEQIAREVPAVVVMNLSMPVLDGWETTRRIKKNAATAHVSVIVVTGHANQHALDRATAAGADAILLKPFPPRDLLDAVDAFMRPARVRAAPAA